MKFTYRKLGEDITVDEFKEKFPGVKTVPVVTTYGMNENIGNVIFYDPSHENTFQKPFSEENGKIIDEEVRKMIGRASSTTDTNMLYGKDDYAGTIIDLNNNFIDINIYVNEIQKYINSTEFYNSKVEQIKYVLEKLNFNKMVDDYLNYFYEN
jgi:hypothetical protein